MSDQETDLSIVKIEVEPDLYETTYSTSYEDEQESVVRDIAQDPLDIFSADPSANDPSAFMSNVKIELEPGMYTTTYTRTNDNGQESVVRDIAQYPLDISYDINTVKQEPIDEPLDELDTVVKQELQEAHYSNAEYVYNTMDEPLDSELDTVEKDPLGIQDIRAEKVNYSDGKTKNNLSKNEYSENQNQTKKKITKQHSYSCDKCSQSFSQKRLLNTHLLTHGSIRFPCDKCTKSFSTKAHLKTHLLSHEGIRYPCDKCSKSFSYKGSLQTHLLTHEGIRYPCDKCTKSFSQKEHLKTHLLTHEGIRFPCHKCSKSFSQKAHLNTHLLTHEGIMFPCDKCSKSFTRKAHLKTHLLTHEGIRFPCHKCSKYFAYKGNLRTHLLTHNNEDII